MPPYYAFVDKDGNTVVREMTAEEWAAYPKATEEEVAGLPEPLAGPE